VEECVQEIAAGPDYISKILRFPSFCKAGVSILICALSLLPKKYFRDPRFGILCRFICVKVGYFDLDHQTRECLGLQPALFVLMPDNIQFWIGGEESAMNNPSIGAVHPPPEANIGVIYSRDTYFRCCVCQESVHRS